MTDDVEPASSADAEQEAEVGQFWNLARFHARLNPVPGYFGQTALEAVQPPAWTLGENAADADEAIAGLLDGSRTSISATLAEYEEVGQPLPEVGALGIVLDGAGHPRALVVTSEVVVTEDQVLEQFDVLYQS